MSLDLYKRVKIMGNNEELFIENTKLNNYQIITWTCSKFD